MSKTHAPNILFVLLDSLQAHALSCYGNRRIETPHIDAVARAGCRFDRGYTVAPVCHPARCSIFTGMMPSRHGQISNVARNASYRFDRSLPTTATVLREGGYHCGYVGQGHAEAALLGFHDRPDIVRQWWAYRQSTCPEALPFDELYEKPDAPYCGSFEGDERYLQDDWYSRGAVDMIREYARQNGPWFIHCDFDGPHTPLVLPRNAMVYGPDDVCLPDNIADSFAGKMAVHQLVRKRLIPPGWTPWHYRNLVAHYWSYVHLLDGYMGRLLAALEETGAAERTLVVVTSDHGELIGAHGQFIKYPCFWEELVRVPMVARWPGRVEPGTVRTEFATHLDWLATLAGAAGIVPPKTMGFDLFEAAPPNRNAVVAECAGLGGDLCSLRMLRTERYKYVYNPLDVEELYDLQTDPAELHNRATDPSLAGVLADCRRQLHTRMAAQGDPLASSAAHLTGGHPITGRPITRPSDVVPTLIQ